MSISKIISIVGVLIIVSGAYLFGARSQGDMQVVAPKAQSTSQETAVVTSAEAAATLPLNGKTYAYTEAPNHVGEHTSITGTVLSVYTAKSGVTFFDFCKSYKTCPFTAVVFSSAVSKFPNLKGYTGPVTVSGLIKSYQGKAEIIIDNPSQIVKQ